MESNEHRLAKDRIVTWLKNRIHIEIEISCKRYKRFGSKGNERYSRCRGYDIYVVKYFDNDEILPEYESANWRADVAVLNREKLRYVFEVFHSSRTTTQRQCLWFEISADQILRYPDDARKVTLRDLRADAKCIECYLSTQDFYPVLGKYWTDYKNGVSKVCTFCKEPDYKPVWQDADIEGNPGFPLASCDSCLRDKFEITMLLVHVPEIHVEKRYVENTSAQNNAYSMRSTTTGATSTAQGTTEIETLKLRIRVLELELENLKLHMQMKH
jgi:hypothetical protein